VRTRSTTLVPLVLIKPRNSVVEILILSQLQKRVLNQGPLPESAARELAEKMYAALNVENYSYTTKEKVIDWMVEQGKRGTDDFYKGVDMISSGDSAWKALEDFARANY
jgi:hypothetical protein